MSKIYTVRSFVDSRSVGTVVDEVTRALTDTGFVCDRILLQEEGLITPQHPDEYLRENEFERADFAHTTVENARAKMRYPTELSESHPFYYVGITFPNTGPLYDREFQQNIVQLVSELSERLDLFYSFLEPVSHTILKSVEQMQIGQIWGT